MAYQPKSYRKFVATAATATLVASAVTPAFAAEFTDVNSNYTTAVNYLVENNIAKGTGETTFGTDNSITRGDAAVMIANVLKLDTANAPESSFTDLNTRVKGAVNALYAKGIINGKSATQFQPAANITRAEMAKVIALAYELEAGDVKNEFTDVNSTFDEYVDKLVNKNITLGITSELFGATQDVTRGQFALFMYRAKDLLPPAPGPGENPGNPVDLEIASVTALNDANSFLQIEFTQPVKDLETTDIIIKDAKTGATYGVQEVKLSSDGKTATVQLYAPANANRANPVLAYTTDYTVTVAENGQVMTAVFNRLAFFEARVTEVDVDDRKITLAGVGTLEVLESVELDFEEAKGRTIHVWFNKDREVVKYQYDSKETVIYSPIQLDKVDEIKTLTDGKVYDISDKEFTFNVNDEEVDYATYRADNIKNNKDPEVDFAKVVIGSNGEIEHVSAYTFANYSVVASVDTKGEQIVGATGTSSISDAADYLIIKDGKRVKYEDLKAGDVVLYNADAYNGDGFAVVYNKTVTGEIETVYQESLVVDGKEYDYIRDTYYAGNMSDAKFLDEDGEYKTVTQDEIEDLQAGGEVTLYLDAKGDLLFITGEMEATVADVAVLTDDVKTDTAFGKYSIQLEALFADKTEKVYNVQLDNLDKITVNGVEYDIDDSSNRDADEYKPTIVGTDIVLTPGAVTANRPVVTIPFTDLAKGKLVEFGKDANGNVDELKVFKGSLSGNQDEAYAMIDTTSTSVNTNDELLESGDSYAVTEDGAKKLKDNTVVYDVTKGSGVSYDAKDVTVTTWKEYKGSDINKATVLYDDDNEVTAIVIQSKVSTDSVYEEAVITKVARNTDGELVSIEAYVNGAKKTIAADKLDNADADALAKGDVALLTFDKGKLDLVKAVQIDGRAIKGQQVVKVDTGKREVTLTNGTTETTYKLANNGAILDGRNNDDIKIEAFADLVGKTNVTVVLDEANGTFAKYFVIEPNNIVTSQAQLNAALADTSITKVSLGADVTGNLAINRPLELDLNGYDVDGTVTFNNTATGESKVTSSTPATITNLTVNTPNADFVVGNNVTVTGTTTITDVKSSTFINQGTLKAVVITDANGTGFNNTGTVSGTVTLNTAGTVTLNGNVANVVATKAAKVTVAPTAKVAFFTATVDGVVLDAPANTVESIQTTNGGKVEAPEGKELPTAPIKFTTGTVKATSVQVGEKTEITVEDADLNRSATVKEETSVTVEGSSTPVKLTETDVNTGVFTGTYATSKEGKLTVTYKDTTNAVGEEVTATTTIDVTPVSVPVDTTAPVVDSVSYTLNGEVVTPVAATDGSYTVKVPAQAGNQLSALSIVLTEDNTVTATATDDINSYDVGALLAGKTYSSVNGKVTIGLNEVATLFSGIDFQSYPVGTVKTIDLTVTDGTNSTPVKVKVEIVAPTAAPTAAE